MRISFLAVVMILSSILPQLSFAATAQQPSSKETSSLSFEVRADGHFLEITPGGSLTLTDLSRPNHIVFKTQLPINRVRLPFKKLDVVDYPNAANSQYLQFILTDSGNQEFGYGVFNIRRDYGDENYTLAGYGSPISVIPRNFPNFETYDSDFTSGPHYVILENSSGERRILFLALQWRQSNSDADEFYLYDMTNFRLLSKFTVLNRCGRGDYFTRKLTSFSLGSVERGNDGSVCRSATEFHYDPKTDQLIFDRKY